MKPGAFNINLLSPHLFWDVDVSKIIFKDSKQFVIKRILEYGLLSDWILLCKHLDINEIADSVANVKDLDRKSLSFIATVSKRPKEHFLCIYDSENFEVRNKNQKMNL